MYINHSQIFDLGTAFDCLEGEDFVIHARLLTEHLEKYGLHFRHILFRNYVWPYFVETDYAGILLEFNHQQKLKVYILKKHEN